MLLDRLNRLEAEARRAAVLKARLRHFCDSLLFEVLVHWSALPCSLLFVRQKTSSWLCTSIPEMGQVQPPSLKDGARCCGNLQTPTPHRWMWRLLVQTKIRAALPFSLTLALTIVNLHFLRSHRCWGSTPCITPQVFRAASSSGLPATGHSIFSKALSPARQGRLARRPARGAAKGQRPAQDPRGRRALPMPRPLRAFSPPPRPPGLVRWGASPVLR